MRIRAKDTQGRTRSRLDYVRESLLGVIDVQLGAADCFNVLAFSSDVHLLSKKGLLEGSEKNKQRARAWIRALRPEEGTNVYLALERAFELEDFDTIYFLSDGSPSEGASIGGSTPSSP